MGKAKTERDKPTEEKPAEQKKAAGRYPLRKNAVLKLQYAALGFLLPAVFLCLALLCLFALVRDLKIGGLGFAGSEILMVFGMFVGLAVAGYFFFLAYQYGTFTGFYYARNSRRFKNEMLKLLSNAVKKYRAASDGNYDDAEKDILRYLQFCITAMRGYKKLHKSNPTLTKLEIVTYNETLKMSAVLDAEGFSHADFLAAVKKVHFCIEERFAGVSAKAYKGEGNYAFISYSHRNSKPVLEVIKRLQETKLNVWFDEGITEGDDWMDHIAKKIDNCSHFVMFQTPAYAKSVNCNVEIKRALKTNRTIIRVILEESKLAEGVEMYLDAIQAIDCRAGVDENKLVKLISLLQPPKVVEKPPEVKKETKPKTQKAK